MRLKVLFLLIIPFLTSGYGYMGELPELGNTVKKPAQAPVREPVMSPGPASIIVPRADSGFTSSKYTDYLADISEIENLLVEIREILEKEQEGTVKNRAQLFNAKKFLLNLYVDRFKEKYGDSPEKYYESYKRLIALNDYLSRDYDEKKALQPIDTVITIINEARSL